MAYYYGLTGHLNRPRLQGAFDEVLTDCQGVGAPAAYLLVNIDHLGMLNDTYVYDTTDAVVVDIRKRADGCAKAGDIVGRVGGNQFGLVLPRPRIRTCGRWPTRSFFGPSGRGLYRCRPLGGVLVTGRCPITKGRGYQPRGPVESETAGAGPLCPAPRLANRDAARRKTLATGDAIMRAMKDGRLTFAV